MEGEQENWLSARTARLPKLCWMSWNNLLRSPVVETAAVGAVTAADMTVVFQDADVLVGCGI